MSQLSVANLLQKDSTGLSKLTIKLKQLTQWNDWLKDALPLEDKDLAKHCQIVGIDRTSLIVIADTAHWVTRFRFFIPNLLKVLQNYPDLKNIGSICCKVRPAHHRQMNNKKPKSTVVLSKKNAQVLMEDAAQIKDEKLRKVMEKIAGNVSIPRED